MRCPYCGNENPADHRFCGMCGRPLVEAAPVAARPEPTPHREPQPPTPAPAYTGGLFNLNAPADTPSSNLDYLLDDEDEPKSNKGLIFLTIVALALVVGLGWLRFRHGGLPFLKSLTASSQPKPPATSEVPGDPTSTPPSDQPSSNASASVPSITPVQPTGDSAAPSQPANSSPAPATSTPAPTNAPAASPTSEATSPPANSTNPAPAPVPPSGANAVAPPPTSDSHPATSADTAEDGTDRADGAAARSPAKPKPVAKPAAKPASKPADPVMVGERYLYGREGFPQNCERGLHYVKPAADQSNPKAMITMGALYATGHCLSRDLPTAYRYFALALRSDPENGPLRQNAEMVWKQMTAEERKQAIRMTQ